MTKIGIIEGFFGPAWEPNKRLKLANWMSKVGGDFYLYAPKQDSRLRKKWRESWNEDFFREMSQLKKSFSDHSLEFGVGFTPFGR